MVEATRTQTRPSGEKAATCSGLSTSAAERPPNSALRARTTEWHAADAAMPAAHGRRGILPRHRPGAGVIPQSDKQMRVPVIDATCKPLMPCMPGRARKLLNSGRASARWNKLGMFYIWLKTEIQNPGIQPLVLGIDPGSAYEGYSVVGTKDTAINIMAEAPTWVKKAVETRREMRRARRFRKTRRRPKRFDNRLAGQRRLSPSTRARWEAKARVATQLKKILPVSKVVVEDVQAVTKKSQGAWNRNFSPIQVGKEHLYRMLEAMDLVLVKKKGTETKALRDELGLKKVKGKSLEVFESHCVDSWTLAASETGAQSPSTKRLLYLVPLQFHRRQLHRREPGPGGIRPPYGGTRSAGLKRGSKVRHPKHGVCYVGGTMAGRVSLHNLTTGIRLCQNARVSDCRVLTSGSWRTRLPPRPEGRGIRREVIL